MKFFPDTNMSMGCHENLIKIKKNSEHYSDGVQIMKISLDTIDNDENSIAVPFIDYSERRVIKSY